METMVVLIVGVILIAGAGIFIFAASKDEQKQNPAPPQPTARSTQPGPSAPDASPMLRALEETKSQLQNPLPAKINTDRWIYITERPFGIKLITFSNWISIILNILSVILFVCFMPFAIKVLQEKSPDVMLAAGVPTVVIVIGTAVTGLWTFFIFLVNQGLWNFRGWARVVQIIFCIPALFMFPIGTIISVVFLYFLLLDPSVSLAFQKQRGVPY